MHDTITPAQLPDLNEEYKIYIKWAYNLKESEGIDPSESNLCTPLDLDFWTEYKETG